MFVRAMTVFSIGWALVAASPLAEEEAMIRGHIETIKAAALSSEVDKAGMLYHRDFVLVSQSGSVYDRTTSLLDLKSGFAKWENSEVRVDVDGDTAIVVLINTRQRAELEPASFRVMQVWKEDEDGWKLVAQSSARIKKRS